MELLIPPRRFPWRWSNPSTQPPMAPGIEFSDEMKSIRDQAHDFVPMVYRCVPACHSNFGASQSPWWTIQNSTLFSKLLRCFHRTVRLRLSLVGMTRSFSSAMAMRFYPLPAARVITCVRQAQRITQTPLLPKPEICKPFSLTFSTTSQCLLRAVRSCLRCAKVNSSINSIVCYD